MGTSGTPLGAVSFPLVFQNQNKAKTKNQTISLQELIDLFYRFENENTLGLNDLGLNLVDLEFESLVYLNIFSFMPILHC